jgi:hypothetical protein
MSIQDKIMNAELKAMTDTALTEPVCWCGNAMERQMAKTYTRNIFNRFRKELPNADKEMKTRIIIIKYDTTNGRKIENT